MWYAKLRLANQYTVPYNTFPQECLDAVGRTAAIANLSIYNIANSDTEICVNYALNTTYRCFSNIKMSGYTF